MRKRSYLLIGSHDLNTGEQISAFRVTSKVIESIAKQWAQQFPHVSYIAINYKHSKIYYKSEEEKNEQQTKTKDDSMRCKNQS